MRGIPPSLETSSLQYELKPVLFVVCRGDSRAIVNATSRTAPWRSRPTNRSKCSLGTRETLRGPRAPERAPPGRWGWCEGIKVVIEIMPASTVAVSVLRLYGAASGF